MTSAEIQLRGKPESLQLSPQPIIKQLRQFLIQKTISKAFLLASSLRFLHSYFSSSYIYLHMHKSLHMHVGMHPTLLMLEICQILFPLQLDIKNYMVQTSHRIYSTFQKTRLYRHDNNGKPRLIQLVGIFQDHILYLVFCCFCLFFFVFKTFFQSLALPLLQFIKINTIILTLEL